MLNLDVDKTFKKSQIEVNKCDSDNAFHCEIDQKMSDILEFNPNFKVMVAFLTSKPEESTVEEISWKRDGFNVLMSNARGLDCYMSHILIDTAWLSLYTNTGIFSV